MTQTSRSLTLESPVADTGHLANGGNAPTIAQFADPVRGPSNNAACLPLLLYRGTSCDISEQSTADVEATKNILLHSGCVRYFLSGVKSDWAWPCIRLAESLFSPHAYQTNPILAICHGEGRSSLSAWRATTRCGSVRYSGDQEAYFFFMSCSDGLLTQIRNDGVQLQKTLGSTTIFNTVLFLIPAFPSRLHLCEFLKRHCPHHSPPDNVMSLLAL